MTRQLPSLVYFLDQDINDEHITSLIQLIPALQSGYTISIVVPYYRIPDAIHRLSDQFPTVDITALDIDATTSWFLRVRTLITLFRELTVDVVHIMAYSIATHTATLVALKIAQMPHIILSLDMVVLPADTPAYMRLLYKALVQIPSQIVVYTTQAKQHLVHTYALRETLVTVAPIGVDDRIYLLHKVTPTPRSAYQIPEIGYVVAVCAPCEQPYGQDLVIRAMSSIWQYHPETRLIIAGDGSQVAQLQNLAQYTVQPHYVHFVPTPDDIASFFAGVDIVVYPARQSAMPSSLLIAMALERPVVASMIPNVQEIIEANGNGLLTPANDADAIASAVIRLLNDHALRISIAFNARSRVSQRFRKDAWLTSIRNCYRMY